MTGEANRARPARGWDSLTPAERRVVSLVGEALTNDEVGRRLFISRRTVGHHLGSVYKKLEIRSRNVLIKDLGSMQPGQGPHQVAAQPS